jgi:hypothetical protein
MLWGFGGCVAGFVAALLLLRPEPVEEKERARSAADTPLQSNAEVTRSTDPEPPVLERPDSRIPVLTERPVEPEERATEPALPTATIDPSDPRTFPENTYAEMEAKYDALNDYLGKRTMPIFEQAWKGGLFEHISDEPVWRGGDSDQERREIYTIVGTKDGIDRMVLPRWQYPDLYVFKDEIYRLEKLKQEKRIAEARERRADSPR